MSAARSSKVLPESSKGQLICAPRESGRQWTVVAFGHPEHLHTKAGWQGAGYQWEGAVFVGWRELWKREMVGRRCLEDGMPDCGLAI